MAETIDVFLSSTCNDLLDLRAELMQFLAGERISVRASEHPDSDFKVNPHESAIASCLNNVEQSKAVVCIIDRRYGSGVTQKEIQHAVGLKKPIFYFIRDQAWNDFEEIRNGRQSHWIEEAQKEKWFGFVKELFDMPGHGSSPGWFDTFKSITDMKSRVLRRLIHQFPQWGGSLALQPDRMVRMTFIMGNYLGNSVKGGFRNVGLGSALNVVHGSGECPISSANHLLPFQTRSVGGVLEGEITLGGEFVYPFKQNASLSCVFCDYENRFRDKYRLIVPFDLHEGLRPEILFVRQGSEEPFNWLRVL